MNIHISIDTIPQEVLEHIAYFASTESFLGPPASLIPLLATNRRVNSRLSISSNPHLYARIFEHKFDTVPALHRFGEEWITPYVLAHELQRRCLHLKRIRSRLDATIQVPSAVEDTDANSLEQLLFHAYLLMLENTGKNERQLRDYAKMDIWLREYWFDEHGASSAISSTRWDMWPSNNTKTSLAMWLFWFLLKPDDYPNNSVATWTALNTLRVFALAAHKYTLATPSWVDFIPKSRNTSSTSVMHYFESYRLTPPPLATPAILSFLTLVNKMSQTGNAAVPLPPSIAPLVIGPNDEWSCEWGRCISLGQGEFSKVLTASFKPGSIDGVWEGLFTYTEFTAYAALLAGAPPPILQKSMVVRHQQTWKLREHHLLAQDSPHSVTGISKDMVTVEPLSAGDPLRSYFPTGAQIRERRDGIDVQEPGSCEVLRYQRASPGDPQGGGADKGNPSVLDIIITGEGHSAWGQFNLVGRVRPCDGFISLSKEYVDGDRGKWLYRGYLVGNANGNFAGRWRDTLSPADVPGYEGCFAMSRRR